MKKICTALCLLFTLGCFTGAMAADDKKMMKKEAPADGSTISVVGMMAVKSPDSKGDVVCRLTTGKNKNDPRYNLVATGEVAKQIEAMRQEGDKVKVTGKVNGENLEVASIEKQVYMRK